MGEEHSKEMTSQAAQLQAERQKAESEAARLQSELEAQKLCLHGMEVKVNKAENELSIEKREVEKLTLELQRRQSRERDEQAKASAELEQLQTLFASQQTTISQHRRKAEDLAVREKVMGAALVACACVIGM